MRTTLRVALPIAATVAILFCTQTAFAGTASTCTGEDKLGSLFCSTNLSDMLNIAFHTAILVGAVLAMLRIGYAGFLYMGSADMWSNKSRAKEVFQDAIIGLLILLSIYMILFQINPDILSLRIGPGGNLAPTTGVPAPTVVAPGPPTAIPATPLPQRGRFCAVTSRSPTLGGPEFRCGYADLATCRSTTDVAVAQCIQLQGGAQLSTVARGGAPSGLCADSLSAGGGYVCGFNNAQECFSLATVLNTAYNTCRTY